MNLNRREFLKVAALGAGGVVATTTLPVAADDPGAFPYRGDIERMVLAYQHVHIGLEKPFSVLHISDTHLMAIDDDETDRLDFARLRRRTFGGRQEEALRDSLAWARKNVDAVVHTGDIIDFQTKANLRLVEKYFGTAGLPLAASMGNHEFWRCIGGERAQPTDAFNALSRKTLAKSYPFDIELQSTIVGGVNFVTIEQVYGFVTAHQVERFAAEVKKGLPIVLCMHVPFMTDGIWRAKCKYRDSCDRKYTDSALPDPTGDYKRQTEDRTTAEFVRYLKSEPLLKAILAGHLHITVSDRFSPTAMEYVVGGNFMFHGEEVLFT